MADNIDFWIGQINTMLKLLQFQKYVLWSCNWDTYCRGLIYYIDLTIPGACMYICRKVDINQIKIILL